MKLDIIRIGNSKGLRLPKSLLEQCRIGAQVELTVEGDRLVLKPVGRPRDGWEDGFVRMAAAGDDVALLDEDAPSGWDDSEWTW